MSAMPKFNFAVTVTDADLQKEQAKRTGGWIKEGEQDLEILKVEYKKQAEKDPTWCQFAFIMGKPGTTAGPDGKFKGVIYHNVMVPTQDIKYNGGLGVFGMLQGLMSGFGVSLSATNVAEVMSKYFTDFTALQGISLKVKVGYEGNHIVKDGDTFKAVDKTKKPLPLSTDNEFESRNAALGQAIVDGFSTDKGMKILRVLPSEEVKEPKSNAKPRAKGKVTTFEE